MYECTKDCNVQQYMFLLVYFKIQLGYNTKKQKSLLIGCEERNARKAGMQEIVMSYLIRFC